MVPERRRMPGLYPSVALAGWVCLPTLRMDWRAVGDVAGTVALSRLTKPMSAAPKRESGAGKPKQRPSSRWRPRRGVAASAGSAFGALRTCPRTAFFPSSRMPCRPDRWSIPTDGVVIAGWRRPATSTKSLSSATARNRPMRSCRESTPLLRFSSGGCSAPTRAAFSTGISTTTSTNSPSGSIDGAHEPGGCSSTDSPNRLSLSDRSPTASSSELPIPIARLRNWSEGDTQLQLKHMGVRIQPA